MVRQDIVAGLKNAIERGDSLENAKQILVNSGYNGDDVDAAASYVDSVPRKMPVKKNLMDSQKVTNKNIQPLPQEAPLENKTNRTKIILISSISVVSLIVIIGILYWILH